MRQTSAPITATGDIAVNIDSFALHLRAENLSPRTQQTYMESCLQFATFLAQTRMPEDVTNIKREHVEAFIASLLGSMEARHSQQSLSRPAIVLQVAP